MHATPKPRSERILEQRQIPRHQLSAFLRVYNSQTDRPFGYIGNVSRLGVMLITPLPVMLQQEYQLMLKLPALNGLGFQSVPLRVHSHWCRQDISPGFYDCGFSIVSNPNTFSDLALMLRGYFSFGQAPDA
tara:strand:+ start:2148 stop:2540 length:393 start_codon:yes stop_codon:yes gene_type:complete